MFKQAIELIRKYDTVIIHRHSNPDGDAIGSQYGLKQLILNSYPDKKVYAVGDGTKRYAFMDGAQTDTVPDETYNDALADTQRRIKRYALTTIFSAKKSPT